MKKYYSYKKRILSYLAALCLCAALIPPCRAEASFSAGMMAYDYLDFDGIISDSTEIKTDLRLRSGGDGWASYWTTSTKKNQDLIGDNRIAQKVGNKFYLNPYARSAFLRRWFKNEISTGENGSYTFGFTVTNSVSKPFNNETLDSIYYIGSGDESRTPDIYTGIEWFIEGEHPENTEDTTYPAGPYAVLCVGEEKTATTQMLTLDVNKPYSFTLRLDTKSDGKEEFVLEVKAYGTNTSVGETLSITQEYGTKNLSYIDIRSYGYGGSYFGDFIICDNYSAVEVTSMHFEDKDDNVINFSENVTDSVGIELSAKNNSDEEKMICTYIAIYNGKKLVSTATDTKAIGSGKTKTLEALISGEDFPEDYTSDKYTIKAYLFDDDLVPQKEPYVLLNSSLYVSSTANGGGSGTEDSPYTLSEALNAVASINEEGKPLPAIELLGGDYELASTVFINNKVYGTNDNPLVIKAKEGDEVNFVGGITIPISEDGVSNAEIRSRIPEAAQNYVREVNLSDYDLPMVGASAVTGNAIGEYDDNDIEINEIIPYEVMLDGKSMTLARWPNDGVVQVRAVIDTGTPIAEWNTTDEAERTGVMLQSNEAAENLSKWQTAEYATITGYFGTVYSDLTIPIAEFDAQRNSIITALPIGKTIVKDRDKFFISNLIEELDFPGEYYIDRDTNILYYYPDENSEDLYISTLNQTVMKLTDVENLKFDGINFYGGRKDSIIIDECENIKFENCIVAGCAGKAFTMQECKKCVVSGCEIYDVGKGGVWLDGGDYTTLEPGENIVENSHIYNFSRIKRNYSPAVYLRTVGNIAQNNEIHDSSGNAIIFNGNDHTIKYNEIYNVVKEVDDAAAIYAFIEKIRRGTVISHNYIHDLYSAETSIVGASAVYTDGRRDGTTVTNNLFENIQGTAYLLNCGRDNTFTNNICINVGKVLHYPRTCDTKTLEELAEYGLYENGIHTTAPYAKYPHLANILNDDPAWSKYNVIKDNVVIDSASDINLYYGFGATDAKLALNGDTVEASLALSIEEAGFVDYTSKNYALKSNSKIYDEITGFTPVDFENVGIK